MSANNSNRAVETTPGMKTEQLLETILGSENLPTVPTVASKLLALTAKDDTTLSAVADLVALDVALCSKILKVSNSAFYSFPHPIGSAHQAISMMGTNATRSLVLSFSFLSMRAKKENPFDFNAFWKRSLVSAVAAKLILEHVPGANTEEILIAGLLQNMGVLMLACTYPEEYEKVLSEVKENGVDLQEAEIQVFGADHSAVGYGVAKHWNFPDSILLPILHHHSPTVYNGSDTGVRRSIRAIYVAELLINIFYSDDPSENHKQFAIEAKKLLGLKPDAIEAILGKAHLELEMAGKSFGLNIEEPKPVQEILQEANIRLSHLNLDYDQMNKQLIEAKVSLEKLTKELKEKNYLLKNLADVDGLTGRYNNRYFQIALDKELSRAARQKGNLSLVMIDIDHFKRFNDTYGHLVGDFILVEFGNLLASSIREYDTLARYGGEEFIAILPGTSEEEALIVGEKLRSVVEKGQFIESGEEHVVTASFGVACFSGGEEGLLGKNELIKRADDALYVAKERGRNKVVAYTEPKKKWFKLK